MRIHILRKLPPAKVVSSRNFRPIKDHPLFIAGGGRVIGGGPAVFSKKLGVGMLNVRSGDLQIFAQRIGSLVSFGYHKKTDCYYIDNDKRCGEVSGPSDLCLTFKSLADAFGKPFTLDLKFDLNQSADQMKVGSFCKPGAFNSHPNYMGSV